CNDPVALCHERQGQYHVQFFDDPVSRAWILKRNIKPYTGSVQPGIPVKIKDGKLQEAIDAAEDALNLDRKDRHTVIKALDSADDKDSSGEKISKRKVVESSEESSDEDSPKLVKRKRFKRVSVANSDSEDEYKPDE